MNNIPALTIKNPFFQFCCDLLEELCDQGLLPELKNELNNFTSTIVFHSYYYYACDLFFYSAAITRELKCLDLTYLMEQRLRYTGIRKELESFEQHVCEIRRNCEKCLRESECEEESEQKTIYSKEIKKKKKKKTKDLDVLNHFWFKRDPSPPPEGELENHLDEIRTRTRKEIHTLLFLSKLVKEAKINLLKEQAAMLNEKDQQIWGELINSIETKDEAVPEEPKEYNNNQLMARLETNPELVEAINKIKAEKVASETRVDDTFEFARKIERQFFSLIPGIPGLTAYKNVMISEIAWDESNTLIL